MSKILYLAGACLFMFTAIAQASDPVNDPTKPLGFSGAASFASADNIITLTSILISSERRVAIINGELVKENQTIKNVGAIVKKIDADAVTLQQNGKVWRVAINNTAIRK